MYVTSNQRSLVVIDSSVASYQELASGVTSGSEVVVLDAAQDGIEQITQALAHRADLDALHIISHGHLGALHLGSTQLDLNTLAVRQHQIQEWFHAFSRRAQVLLYGCQVAAGDRGVQFVQQLSRLLQAPVAASTRLVGHAALGGHWQLDYQTAAIAVPLALRPEVMATYHSVFAPVIPKLLYAASGASLRVVDLTSGQSTLITTLPFPTFALTQSQDGLVYFVGTGSGTTPGATTGTVGFYNPITNSTGTIGRTGIGVTILKLAESAGGVIYGIDEASTNLYQVSKTTGAATSLGPITGGTTPFTAGSGDIAFDPTNPNRLFITVAVEPTGADPDGEIRLYSIDISTIPPTPGPIQATFIGNTGLTNVESGSLAFGGDGQLYMTSGGFMYTVNTANAVVTQIGATRDQGQTVLDFNDFASIPGTTPVVDVAIAKTDNLTNVQVGGPITYTITVTNLAPAGTLVGDLLGLSVNDIIPAEITNVTWSGSVTGGGAFVTPSTGTGNAIASVINLNAGATATFTVQGTVSAPVGASLTNTATVATLPGIIDANPSNNTATDITTVVAVLPPNTPPTANPVTVPFVPGTTAPVPGLGGSDPDGTIQSFVITAVPPAAQGTLFLGNPASGGTPITVNQQLRPDQINQVFFQPSGSFTGGNFTYIAQDNLGASSPPATVSLALSPNQPPIATNPNVNITPGGVAPIPGPLATDNDGAIVGYTITALPPANQGTLFIGNPATGGTPVAPNQALTPQQAGQLFFQATPTFTGGTFSFTATDNQGATVPGTTSLVQIPPTAGNQPPIAANPNVNIAPGGVAPIPGPLATDNDGAIVGYTITALPPANQGTLFIGNPATGGTPVTPNQALTPQQAGQLFFQAAPTFTGGTFSFTATDNQGATVPGTTGLLQIPPTAGNQAPQTGNTSVDVPNSGLVALPPLPATDADGQVTNYIINSLPPASQGTLFVRNPAQGGRPAVQGETIGVGQASQLFFQPSPTFSGGQFQFTAIDDRGTPSPTRGTISLVDASTPPVGNSRPVAGNETIRAPRDTTVALPVLPATDADGQVTGFILNSLPPVSQGTLFVRDPAEGGRPARDGETLGAGQAAQLFFQASNTFTSARFTFTPRDNQGARSAQPGTISLLRQPTPQGGNQPPVTQDSTVRTQPGGVAPIRQTLGTDVDGTVTSYTITRVPIASQGGLFIGNPLQGGTRVRDGQVLTAAQANRLFFQASNQFNNTRFTFTATDNRGAVSGTQGTVLLRPVNPPIRVPGGPCIQGELFRGTNAGEVIRGTDGIDRIFSLNGRDTVLGFQCSDLLVGGQNVDVLGGGGQNDILRGRQNNDRMHGANGNDRLNGGAGNDIQNGNNGNDLVWGSLGNDLLNGNNGNDRVLGGHGNDRLAGGNGSDLMEGGLGRDVGRGDAGNDRMFGRQDADKVRGNAGNDRVDGGGAGDLLDGGAGNDFLNGNWAADTLYGKGGSDRIFGRDGNDWIIGGAGADILSGGSLNDRFLYTSAADRGDTITDFQPARDVIDLKRYFRRGGFSGSDRFGSFVRLTAVAGGTAVRVAPNGAAAPADFFTMVTLSNVAPGDVTARNFLV